MIQPPRVAVVIPVCNGERFIGQAIESVLNQTFQDFVIVIVANGCTDQTIPKIEEFEDPRITLRIVHKKIGVSAARNMGILTSDSEFITFLDADDTWLEHKLECQVRELDINKDAGLVYSWVMTMSEEGRLLTPCNPAYIAGYALREILLSNFIGCGSNAMLRRNVVEYVGDFRSDVICAEDWEYWIRTAIAYNFACVPEYHVYYRQVTTGISNLIPLHTRSAIKVIERVYRMVPTGFKELKPFSIRELRHYLVYKALNHSPSRANGWYGIRSMMIMARLFPAAIRQGWFWKVIIRSSLYVIAPSKATAWCHKIPRYTDISGLTIQDEPI